MDTHIGARRCPIEKLDPMSLEPCHSELGFMLGIIVLLENNPGISHSTIPEVLEASEEWSLEDFNIIRCAHNPLNLVKPPHPSPGNASPYHDVSPTVFDCFFDETIFIGLSGTELCPLAAIRLE
jgi:hypothetical protein